MSFISKLKSPFKKKSHLLSTSTNNSIASGSNTDSNRRVIIFSIDPDNESTFELTVRNDDIGDNLIDRVCEHFSVTEYKEYFGLKYSLKDEKGNHELLWLDPGKTIHKQLKHTNNMLTFRVKHFPGEPHKIECEYVRYLIFLQLKAYLQKGELQLGMNDECLLTAYVVQSMLGDYDDMLNSENYLEKYKFMSKKLPKYEELTKEFHKKLKGKRPDECESMFLEKVSQMKTYGAEILIVKNKQNVLVNFGVSHRGIITYLHGTPALTAKVELYPWSQIGSISFDSRSLHIHAHTPNPTNSEIIKKHTMVFKCNSERICKHLWKYILDQKAFFTCIRGKDVPKYKSSKSLFHRKSTFRYSGRCEQELIFQQREHQSQNTTLNTTTQSYRKTIKRPVFVVSDKSLTDSGVSDNDERLQKLDESLEVNNKIEQQEVVKEQIVSQEKSPQDQNIMDPTTTTTTTITTSITTNTNTPPSTTTTSTLETQPNATSTPQIKKTESKITTDQNIQFNTSITTTTTTAPSSTSTSSANLTANKTSSTSLNQTNGNLINSDYYKIDNNKKQNDDLYPNNNNQSSSNESDNETSKQKYVIKIKRQQNPTKKFETKKIIYSILVIAAFILVIILFFSYLTTSKSSSTSKTSSSSILSTVFNLFQSSASSLSVSVRNNLKNSRLMFDPLFALMLNDD